MTEKLDSFLASIAGIRNAFEKWRKTPPTPEEIQNEWNYFSELLKVVQSEEIDKETIVYINAQSTMSNFSEFMNIGAQYS